MRVYVNMAKHLQICTTKLSKLREDMLFKCHCLWLSCYKILIITYYLSYSKSCYLYLFVGSCSSCAGNNVCIFSRFTFFNVLTLSSVNNSLSEVKCIRFAALKHLEQVKRNYTKNHAKV